MITNQIKIKFYDFNGWINSLTSGFERNLEWCVKIQSTFRTCYRKFVENLVCRQHVRRKSSISSTNQSDIEYALYNSVGNPFTWGTLGYPRKSQNPIRISPRMFTELRWFSWNFQKWTRFLYTSYIYDKLFSVVGFYWTYTCSWHLWEGVIAHGASGTEYGKECVLLQ